MKVTLDEIKERIQPVEKGIVLVKERGRMDIESLNLSFDYKEEIKKSMEGDIRLVIDLSNTALPSVGERNLIKRRMVQLAPSYVAFFLGNNFLMRVAIRFVLMGQNYNFSVHKSYDEALVAVRNAMGVCEA